MPSALRKQRNLERKERTRQTLLAAAGRMFTDKGYHRTLISDIVSDAGLGQGTFYRFFPSKRAIFMTLLDGFFADLLGEFSEMSVRPPTNLEEYRHASMSAVRRVAAKVDENRELALMFLRETPSIDRKADEKLSQLFESFANLAKIYLDHAIAHGFARPCKSEVVAQSLVGIGVRIMYEWFEGRFGDQSLEELSREVVDFAFLGFGLMNGKNDKPQKES